MDSNTEMVTWPELLTEAELIRFLRIPDVAARANPANILRNLKQSRGLPCLHISRQPLYPLAAVRQWMIEEASGYTGGGSASPARKKGGEI